MRFHRCVVFVLLAACAKSAPAPALDEAPLDFTLPSYPSREAFSLKSERGRVVMLDVWATWCDPCRESLPQYQAMAGKFASRGLRLYAVNVDGEAAVPLEIPKFISETKLTVPVLLDTDAKLSEERLKVKVMPTALLIDRQGRLRYVHEGFERKSLAQLEVQLEALLAEP